MPALFTSTSMRPNSATVASMSAAHSSQSPTWHRTASARRPSARISSATILARFDLAARDDDVGAGFGESQRHGPAQALAGPGDDDDLAVASRLGMVIESRSAFRACVAGDAVDQVADVDVEQRVGFGRVDAPRVAAGPRPPSAGRRRPAPRLDRDEADGRPHQQAARLHGGVGAEAVVAASRRRAAATPRRRRRARPEDEPAVAAPARARARSARAQRAA